MFFCSSEISVPTSNPCLLLFLIAMQKHHQAERFFFKTDLILVLTYFWKALYFIAVSVELSDFCEANGYL